MRSLELHVLPKIGNTPIDQITPMIVINSLRPLAEKEVWKLLSESAND
ncbi:hypothetical protein [Vibrio taketomensis]